METVSSEKGSRAVKILSCLIAVCTAILAGCLIHDINEPVLKTPNQAVTYAKEENVLPLKAPTPLEQQYIGLTFENAAELAKKQGRRIRVGSEDGKIGVLKANFVGGRITVDLENGVVSGIAMVE